MTRTPEVARALPELVAAGVLTPERAAPLLAAARGELVSMRAELRALLGLGVALVTTGVGLFLKEHAAVLGPTAIAALLTLAAAGALWALAKRAPPFGWGRAVDADWIVDGLLLLAVALVGADLAWIETQFTPLGADWPWHLLAMSAVTAALAIRCDSIVGWTLALTTFAAWRGVSLSLGPAGFERHLFGDSPLELRLNLLFCAALFALAGWALVRTDRKAHFEPSSTLLATLAAGFAFSTGLVERGAWPLWTLALGLLGGAVARFAFVRRRLGLFALAALAIYVAFSRFLIAALDLADAGVLGCFWFAGSTVGAIALLWLVHRKFQEAEAVPLAASAPASTSTAPALPAAPAPPAPPELSEMPHPSEASAPSEPDVPSESPEPPAPPEPPR